MTKPQARPSGRRKPPEAPSAAVAEPPRPPLPTRGGAFRRLDDGRLIPEGQSPDAPADATADARADATAEAVAEAAGEETLT